MKDYDSHDWLPTREEALKFMLEKASFAEKTETIRVEAGLGRVIAEDISSRYTLPNTTNCRWDGVAVRFDDFADGMPDTSAWQCGKEYVFGNTGIAMQSGYDTLIVIEDVDIDENGRLILRRVPKERGEFTTPVGSSIKQGQILVRKYEKLTPNHLSLIAMGGHRHITTLRRPVVAIIPSGNELVPPDMEVPLGKNVETNSIMLAAKAQEWGADPLVYGIVPDDYQMLLDTIRDAARKADLVLFNAGSSKGTDDYAQDVMKAAGELFFHRVSYGPGHHTAFAVVENTPVLGLVGVPGGADFNADWYGGALIKKYYHQPVRKPQELMVTVVNDHTRHKGIAARNGDGNNRPQSSVQMYVRLSVWKEYDRYYGRFHSPADSLRSVFVEANAYLCISPDRGEIKAGDQVAVFLRYPWEESIAESVCSEGCER